MCSFAIDGILQAELRKTTTALAERRQFHQIVLRNRLQRFAGFAPGRQSADYHERVESFFPQQVRHTGAGGLACSSAVKINVFVLGESLDLFLKIIRLNADRAFNPRRARVVIAVTADVDDQHPVCLLRGQTPGQFFHLHARHHAIHLVLAELDDAVNRVHPQGNHNHRFNRQPRSMKSAQDSGQKIA